MTRTAWLRPLAALALLAILAAPGRAEEAAARWSTRAPLPDARTEVSVTGDGTRLYLLGGFGPRAPAEPDAPRAVYAYQPAADAWTHLTDLPEGVNHAGLAHAGGALYVIGGFREASFDAVATVRILDLATGLWREGPPLAAPRGAMAVAVHDGRIHAIGGVNAAGGNTGAHEVLDPSEGLWRQAAPLPDPRDHAGAATVGGEIVVLAGRNRFSATLTRTHVYDTAQDRWRIGAPVPTGRSGVAAAALDGWVYLFGGERFRPGATFDTAERYDPAADRWESLPPMPTARHGLGAAVLEGRIHVVSGGPQAGFSFGAAHEVLEPPR